MRKGRWLAKVVGPYVLRIMHYAFPLHTAPPARKYRPGKPCHPLTTQQASRPAKSHILTASKPIFHLAMSFRQSLRQGLARDGSRLSDGQTKAFRPTDQGSQPDQPRLSVGLIKAVGQTDQGFRSEKVRHPVPKGLPPFPKRFATFSEKVRHLFQPDGALLGKRKEFSEQRLGHQ